MDPELAERGRMVADSLLNIEAEAGSMDAFYRLWGPLTHARQPRHEAIARHVLGPRVLDFGCGTGDLLLILQAQHPDWELVGIDRSVVALEMARERGVTAFLLNRADPPLCDSYNTVIFSQVLEHVGNEAALVGMAARIVAPGGRIVVTVPRDGRVRSPDHKREYSPESLRALLEPYGAVRFDDDWDGAWDRMLAVVEA